MTFVAEESRSFIADRLRTEHHQLATRWLTRLMDLVPVGPNDVFPSDSLLDHIPTLILEIANYLEFPSREEIAANTQVIAKARELGELRFDQQASVHQILREYRILEGVLMTFVREEMARAQIPPVSTELVDLLARVHQSVSVLQQSTIETFIGRYAETMDRQTNRLEAFNRMVSHELRQPIGTLQFAVKLLGPAASDGRSRPDQERVLSLVERNVARLSDLTERLARLSGMQDEDSLQVQLVQVTSVAREVGRQLREMAEARSVEIEVDENLGQAIVDLGALELILMNLVSNAIKYSDPDKASRVVRITAAPGADPGFHAIAVVDNGLGIPRPHLETVFEKFFRAHSSRDAELGTDGLGLGLVIVKDCLRTLGGRVHVDSTEGVGTTFTVLIPVAGS